MSTQFDTAGMQSLAQNTAVSGGLQDTNRGNPLGDRVDNTAGDNNTTPQAQGLSSNQGAYLDMQSKPSWLYPT
jgi:hypothetical protein